MAIDKSHTPPWVKAVIIMICIAFVAMIAGSGLLSMGGSTGGTGATGSTSTTDTLNAIAAQAQPVIDAVDTSLTAQPKNYDLLLDQAQNYYDWASQVQQATKGKTGQDTPIWAKALPYYQRAVAATKSPDPGVLTDYSVAMFFSGETTTAISLGKQIESTTPTFTPVVYNLAIFYLDQGDNTSAKAQLQQYLKLAPSGQDAANAQSILKSLP